MAGTYRVASSRDGIGREGVPAGVVALEAAARRYGFTLEGNGANRLELRDVCKGPGGMMMPERTASTSCGLSMRLFSAGRGTPVVPEHVSLWGL